MKARLICLQVKNQGSDVYSVFFRADDSAPVNQEWSAEQVPLFNLSMSVNEETASSLVEGQTYDMTIELSQE